MRLENWSVIYSLNTPPELVGAMLHGFSNCDPNGHEVTTSLIRGKRGNRVLTRNSEYELREPDPKYLEMYPDCRERLMSSLPEIL